MTRSDVLLLLIEERSSPCDQTRYWLPSAYPQWCERLKESITVYGAGDRSALNSLVRKRLVEKVPLAGSQHGEFYRITEDGLLRAQTLA